MNDEKIIISLGGSLIVPEEVDVNFLKDFKDLIVSQIAKGKKFVIVTGGGRTCRKYQNYAKEICNPTTEDLDWIGIATNNLNAQLLRVAFGDLAEPNLIIDPFLPLSFERPIVFGFGWKPGNSSDYLAFLVAKNLGAKKIINLSNIDYVYDADPKVNPNAKKIEKISWADYREIIPKEWTHAGLNSPFDPIASKGAQEEGMTVMIMNGKPLENLANALLGKEFQGTTIF